MPDIPRIRFDEANVGARPILPNLRNRLGIVGQFSRGPANQFAFVDGFTEFANVYGSDNELGSIGFQAAWDQGARDFGLVRVLGHETSASGSVIVSGNATKDNTLNFNFTGVQDIVLEVGTHFDMPVVNTGTNYVGTETGHYVFVVTSVFPTGAAAADTLAGEVDAVEGTAYVKYKFIPTTTAFSRLDALDYLTPAELLLITEVTDDDGQGSQTQGLIKLGIDGGTDLTLNTEVIDHDDLTGAGETSSAVPVDLGQGVNITFGGAADNELFFTPGQKFTFYVEAFSYDIDINTGETAVDIMNRITSSINGVEPLGDVDADIQFLSTVNDNYQGTITFELDPLNENLVGSKGAAYDYTITLATPDGSALTTNTAWADDDGGGPNSGLDALYTTDDQAPDLVGMQVSTIEGTATPGTLTAPGTITVTSVVPDTPAAGIYQINLSADLTNTGPAAEGDYTALATPGNGPLSVTFLNPLGTGFQISGAGATQAFTGGTDGPQSASRILYSLSGQRLIELTARSQGKWGNNIVVDIVPIDDVSYRINVTDTDGQSYNPPIVSETFVINLTNSGALDDNGVINELNASYLIRGSFLPKVDNPTGFDVNLLSVKPERLAPVNATLAGTNLDDERHPSFFGPSKLSGFTLEGGNDGPILTEDDYVKAIQALDGQNVNYIFAPGIDTSFKKAQVQLVTVAENSTEIDGLKIAILSAKKGLRPAQAKKEFEHVNSVRAVAVAGWSTYAGQAGTGRYGLSPDALYAGKLATIGFTISPAARSSSGPILNITEVDTRPYISNQSLQLYADGRMEVIIPELNLGGFYFLNGFTTSSDSAWNRVTIRRTYDVIRQDLFQGLQPYKSEPHTNILRRQIETSVNAYFSNLARNGKIANFTQAICNASNNPAENYINGEINVSVSFLPLYAADYINITLTRNTDGGLQIGDAV